MISVQQAITIVQNNVVPTSNCKRLDVKEANGYVLFKDVVSPINMPPFRQSAMDGYALNLHDKLTYNIIDEVKAGDGHQPILKAGDAVRIFTGAPVPETSNTIVIQERVNVNKHELIIDYPITINENIRPLGEQVTKNQIALKKGTLLTPAAIAFLTSLGITEVMVYIKPSIAIVVTGNELVEAGEPLIYGQIYESNTIMLTSALNRLGYKNVSTYKVDDDYKNTVDILNHVVASHDIVIISGGISVGDYDFVGKALQEINVKELFYKVKQKPGKPLFFGKKENTILFALPGNPAAALSCFYIYIHPVLEKMSGNLGFALNKIKSKSESNFIRKGDRAQFLKAIYRNESVKVLDGQNSSMLHTFALANALVYVPETLDSIKINDTIEVILLPIN